MKLLALTVCALLLGVGVYLWQSEIGDDEIFVLPQGYKGMVVILYDQKNGQPMKYEQGKRVYEIPPDGVLRTQFDINEGWHNLDRYHYKVDGRLVGIPYVIEGKDIRSDQVQVCCLSVGKSYRNDNGEPVEFAQFYVGTKEEINTAIEKGEKIHVADLIKSNQ